jgi:membrane protein
MPPLPYTYIRSSPAQRKARRWTGAGSSHAVRLFAEARRKGLTDQAAALTYYSVLSLFPGLIVLVSLLGLLGNEETVRVLIDMVDELAPTATVDVLRQPIEEAIDAETSAGILLVVGIAVSTWSASSYVGAFMRATSTVKEVEEERSFWKLRPVQLALTLAASLLVAVGLLAIVLTGPLAEALGEAVGLGSELLTVWSLAKWPLMFGVAVVGLSLLYRAGPSKGRRGRRLATPGSLLAICAWGIASAGFALYVSNFGSYQAVYGALGSAVVFLIWLWITNLAVLVGAELDAELEAAAVPFTRGPAG